MKKVFVIVSDKNYLEHAKSLFYSAKNDGKWVGDFCLIANNVEKKYLTDFEKFGINIMNIKMDNFYYANFYIFDVFFKKWDYVMYMDCDFTIFDDLNKIENYDIMSKGILSADKEPFKIHQYFCQGWDELSKENSLSEIKKSYDLEKNGFNAGFLSFNTCLINDNTLSELLNLCEYLLPINNHSKIGSDQPIFNLYFSEKVKFIDDNKVCFWRASTDKTITQHHCNGEAPWVNNNYSDRLGKTYYDNYISNLNNFYEKIK